MTIMSLIITHVSDNLIQNSSNLTPITTTDTIFLGLNIWIFALFYAAFAAITAFTFSKFIINLAEIIKKDKHSDEFYILCFNMMKNEEDLQNLDILISRIIRVFGQTLKINDNHPDFYSNLINHLEKLEILIIKKDKKIGLTITQNDDENNHYTQFIHQLITTIKSRHPFSGLNEAELTFFEQFKRDIETNNHDNQLTKLTEIYQQIKTKNSILKTMDQKAQKADLYGLLSLFLTIFGLIEAYLLWLYK